MPDKGGAVVAMNAELYRLLNLQMLEDDNTYINLWTDPTASFQKSLKDLFEGVVEGVLTQSIADI